MSHPVVFGPSRTPQNAPCTVSPDEAYLSLDELRGSHPRRHQMPLDYDVAVALESLTSPWNNPPLVVCLWDSEGKCNPTNLQAVNGAKVLVLGDTHHGLRPLSRAIALARKEPWDLIVHAFNKHHVHWFDEAGLGSGRTVFLPSFGITPRRLEVPEKRTRGVTMCGRLSIQHVYRGCFMAALLERKLPVEAFQGDAVYCARIYNESLISLNISLNGDFNLRNFEIAAAGGFCLADRTAVEPPIRPRGRV